MLKQRGCYVVAGGVAYNEGLLGQLRSRDGL